MKRPTTRKMNASMMFLNQLSLTKKAEETIILLDDNKDEIISIKDDESESVICIKKPKLRVKFEDLSDATQSDTEKNEEKDK